MPASAPAAANRAVVVAPEPFRSLAQVVVDNAPGSIAEKTAALKARFPCIADVGVRRAWGGGASTLTPILRRAVAPAFLGGRLAAALGEDGTLFAVPTGAYSLVGPAVDPAGADASSLRALASAWPALNAPGALPAPLAGLRFGADGWQLRLDDGTVVLWGAFNWTDEKLARLKEALADARTRQQGAFAADLRFFEDGKVLLKPLAAGAGPSLAAARGNLR